MRRSSRMVKIGTVASALALASLTPTAPALAFGHGGGGFHGGGFGGGGWRGGGWGGRGWGGGWGWGPAVGLGLVGYGWGYPYYDYGYYGDGYGGYPACTYRRVAVRTAYGVRFLMVEYC
jgi:hypothetical protein